MDPSLYLPIGLVLLLLAIVLVLYTYGALSSDRVAVARSIEAISALDSSSPEMREQELLRPFGERVVAPSYDRLANLGRRFTPANQVDRLHRRLELAGNPPNWSVDRVLAWRVILLVAGALLGLLITGVLLQTSVVWVIVGVALGAFLGWFIPIVVLDSIADDRSRAIRRALPDTIDLLAISVQAGLAFDAALEQVSRNTTGPLADEFFRVLSEMQIGRSRSDALRALGERTDVDDLRLFVTAMVQADEFGVPISEVLTVQANELRIKRRQYAEEEAQKVPVKLIFPLVLFIMPATFVILIGPAAFRISESILGGG